MLTMSDNRDSDATGETELELTILMPCLNEAETIGICVEKAQKFLAASGTPGEVLVADNGSTDGSIEIAESLAARVIPVASKVYGAALPRLRREDFGALEHEGGTAPAWPIRYEDLEPFYARAEQLYLVHGASGDDPTEPPRSGPFPFPPVKNSRERFPTTGSRRIGSARPVMWTSRGSTSRR